MSEKRDELINLLKISYQHQRRYLASASEAEKAASGTADDWSPKDVLAHMTHWDYDVVTDLANLDKALEDEDDGRDVDHINADIWSKYADKSWVEIEAFSQATHQELIARLQGLSEADLTEPELHPISGGRPLWQQINFTCFYHDMLHLAELYKRRGELDFANQLQEEVAELQLGLDLTDEWRGAVIFNLGCHYALTGQKELALEKVKEGLALRPGLKKWAPQDTDLKILHDDPEFKALLE